MQAVAEVVSVHDARLKRRRDLPEGRPRLLRAHSLSFAVPQGLGTGAAFFALLRGDLD